MTGRVTGPLGWFGIPRGSRAFTLIELLVVMAIMILLGGLIAPSASTILRGNQVSQASDTVVGGLNLARQTALSRNHSVEVRFYKYIDSSIPGADSRYRSFQAFEIDDAGKATAIGKVNLLPSPILIDSGATLSSLIASAGPIHVAAPQTLSIPRAGVTYDSVAFRFRADGSTDLSAGSTWFLTLHHTTDGDPSSVTPPKNFATIQIDPVSGSIITYRP